MEEEKVVDEIQVHQCRDRRDGMISTSLGLLYFKDWADYMASSSEEEQTDEAGMQISGARSSTYCFLST